MTAPQGTQSVQNAALNLRRTAVFSQIGKRLFDGSLLNLNPTALGNLLRAAGVPLPKGAQVSLDIAQMIASGGSFVANYDKAASISSYALPTAAAIQATTDLLTQIGWLTKDSPGAQVLTLGGDIAMVLATGGANILADIKLIIDVAQLSAIGQAIADGVAQSNLRDMVIGRRQQQVGAFQQNYAQYMKGDLNTFDLIYLVAKDSPDFFSNIFPQYGYFLPDTWVMLYAEGSHSDIFGDHESNASTWIRSLAEKDPTSLQKMIYEYLIKPNLLQFKNLDQNLKNQGLISLRSMVVLSLMPPYIPIYRENVNILDLMTSFRLTPHDLEEDFLDKYLDSKVDHENLSAPITFNGVDYFTPYQKSKLKMNAQIQRVINADIRGDIRGLLQDTDAKEKILKWAKPDWSNTLTGLRLPKRAPNGQPILSKLQNTEMTSLHVRCIRNFWSALDTLKKISGDRLFNAIQQEIEQYNSLPSHEEIDRISQSCFTKMISRQMNALAIQNISKFMKTNSQNLILKSNHEPGKPAVFGYKH